MIYWTACYVYQDLLNKTMRNLKNPNIFDNLNYILKIKGICCKREYFRRIEINFKFMLQNKKEFSGIFCI